MRRADGLILSLISSEELRRAYLNVNREDFLPEGSKKFAYDPEYLDRPIAITDKVNTTALTLGLKMLDYLDLKKGDKVLEVGTGCGYYTAIMAEIVGGENVYTVEIDPWLAEFARNRLTKYNVNPIVGDGTIGYKEKSPYSKIIAWASMPTVPCALYEQLSEEGILLTPIGGDRVQHLYRVRKSNKPLIERLDSVIFMKATGLFGFYE